MADQFAAARENSNSFEIDDSHQSGLRLRFGSDPNLKYNRLWCLAPMWGYFRFWAKMVGVRTILLLVLSNAFMTYAWYGHLKHRAWPLWAAILISWGIAFFEYCFQVPANRIGYGDFSVTQLKVIQEVITLVIFTIFAMLYLQEQWRWTYLYSFLCLIGAVFFAFRR